MTELGPVAGALEAGRREGIAPGVAAVVLVRGAVAHASAAGDAQVEPARRPLSDADSFDLASLTKLYATSAAARLVDRGELELDAPASRWLPALGGVKASVTLRHLLAHASGLPAWRPWHESVAADPEGRLAFLPPRARPDANALVPAFRRGRALYEAALASEPLEAPPGARAVYSDLGFVALGFLLERVVGSALDRLIAREVLDPLGLGDTFFVPGLEPERARALRCRAFVATRRAPARGGEILCGAVDDDNAWALGGVAGHAGLFASASDVARFGQAWLDALGGRSAWLSGAVAERFAARDATPGSERALGWDTPAREGSSLGTRLGRGRLGALGHLGFTGTSLWIDRDREVVCALLTNHVHPGGADKPRMRAFRARFHDAVAEALG